MPDRLLPSLAGKRVLVMGLGRFGGGVGVTRWLVGQGAIVTVTDMAGAETLGESLAKLADLPVTFKLGGHEVGDFLGAELLILNPAVDKRTSEPVKAALAAGIPFTTEMNLFLERCKGFTIGVTGSVGKSTTTTLIYEALKAGLGTHVEGADCLLPISDCQLASMPTNRQSAIGNRQYPRVFLGGNIGKSLLSELGKIREQDIVVLELSSFMLEDTPRIGWSPNVAVVTNVYPNHLDRHGTMEEYAAAKRNILRYQKAGDVALVNGDHAEVAGWGGAGARQFTTRGVAALELVLPGEHNQSNARAALAVLEALPAEVKERLDREAALKAIREFAGLSHRLQLVHSVTMAGGRVVRFFNDSKATTPEASITAVQAFPARSAIFIVGGYDKHIDMGAFTAALAERAAGVVGIGQTGEALIDAVRAADGERKVVLFKAGTLQPAVYVAAGQASVDKRVTAIVLSPASASWDQFPNYEKRGELFIGLAKSDGVTEWAE